MLKKFFHTNSLVKLTKFEFKKTFGNIKKIIVLLLIFFVFLNGLYFIFNYYKSTIKINGAILNEDESNMINSLLLNIKKNNLSDLMSLKVVNKNTSIEEVLKKEYDFVVYIKEDTFKKLDRGEKTKFYLYSTIEESYQIHYLKKYMDQLVHTLNRSQNVAMVYYESLKRDKVAPDQRQYKMNMLAFQSISAFLNRGDVLEKDTNYGKNLFKKQLLYFFFLILLFLIYFIYYFELENELKDNLIIRLIQSGYNITSIYVSKIIVGSCIGIVLFITFKIFYNRLFNISWFAFTIAEIVKFIIISFTIQVFIIMLHSYVENHFLKDWMMIIGLIFSIGTSSFLLEYSFKWLQYFNMVEMSLKFLILKVQFLDLLWFFGVSTFFMYLIKNKKVVSS